MSKNKLNKGITLIALVITIIGLLILAGVTIATLTGDNGILGKAIQAKEENKKGTAEEKIKLEVLGSYDENGKLTASNTIANIKKNIPGVTINKGEDFPLLVALDEDLYKIETNGNVEKATITDRTGIKVGDYINYEPDDTAQTTYSKDNLVENITGSTANTVDITRDNLKWQVLKIYEDGSMDLIGSPTSQKIYFRDATGYNNGVYIMHDICEKIYSRKGIKARSLTLKDMENSLTDEGKKAKNNDIRNRISSLVTNEYIEKVNIEKNTITYKNESSYYPNVYQNEVENMNKLELDKTIRPNSYKQEKNLTVMQTYYEILVDDVNYGNASKVLYNNSDAYWIASRYVYCFADYTRFGLRNAGLRTYGNHMFDSRS
ncbi:hypothetical protein [uncultured Clostridium sp.]|uniref:hypothetical protein n=1 Tax=uncultured Clostridium sp. TaxID=59620 RepID=UPI00272D62B1|nr:hypothetical protein [uncultured Clostridium sp.]